MIRSFCLAAVSVLALPSALAAQSLMVRSDTKISETTGGFTGTLNPGDGYGFALAVLGDLDGDGKRELAVGAIGDEDGGSPQGAVWILSLNPDGTVASQTKISATVGGFGGNLDLNDDFGVSLAALGDLNGDGTVELAVGADGDDDGLPGRGAVWILSLNPSGTVASWTKISATSGGFGGFLHRDDWFGSSLAVLGDLNGDGTVELAVGARGDDDGGGVGTNEGAVWILSLNPDGTVASQKKISLTAGGFGGVLDRDDSFGFSLTVLGDLDGDGTVELAVGARGDDDGGFERGAVWILSLNPDGTVASQKKISQTAGGFGGVLGDLDYFGASLAALGDLNGDGTVELAVGANFNDDGEYAQGAVWVLSLNPDATVASWTKISEKYGGLGCVIDFDDIFGTSVAALGDLDGDGRGELAVGAAHDGDVGLDQGSVFILFLGDPVARSATFAGDGVNRDTIAPVNTVMGGSWSAPLTLGHPHGTGGLLTLAVRTFTHKGGYFHSPIGARLTQVLVYGTFLGSIRGYHNGVTGDIPPQPIPDDASLLGLTWAAQYAVVGGGFGDYSQAVWGVIGY